MKIVMVSKALVVGAYQRKMEELARWPDLEVFAVVPRAWRDGANETLIERVHTSGYELLVVPIAFNGQYHLHFYPTLGPLLRRLRPDVLHMDEEPYNFATWHGMRLGESIGCRSLFFTWQNLNRHYPWPFRGFERSNYRRASYAIAGSQSAARVLREKAYEGPVAVVPQFGVDPDAFAPPASNHDVAERAEPSLNIGYAGRLVPEKGLDILLRACAAARLPDWRLLIRGDGPARPQLEQLAGELGLGDRVRFLGAMPSTSMPDFYRSLDIFVLPSLTRVNWAEQFARVLIEAMACGIPVLGSSSGEIPEVLGDGGIVFPEGDVDALGRGLTELAGDVERRRELGRRGRARVLANFTQAHVAAATAEVYREMMVGGT